MRPRGWAGGILTLLLAAFALQVSAQDAATPGTPAAPASDEKKQAEDQLEGAEDRWKYFLADWSAPPVSASGMLGLSGENVTSVDNKRNLTVALQGLLDNDPGNAFGVSITPARTSLAPMDLANYGAKGGYGRIMRLLGNLTLSYAQGPATIESVEYKRKAYAIDTNFFFKREDDPAVAYALQYAQGDCWVFAPAKPDGPVAVADTAGTEGPAEAATAADDATVAAVTARAEQCHADAQIELGKRWNRSQMSIAYGEAHIRPQDNSKPEEPLGRSLVVTLLYGFENLGGSRLAEQLRGHYALTLNYRRSSREPVLETLAQPETSFKSSSLFIARLTGGSANTRLHVEFSDARSRDITASQRAFKRALGLDYRITEGAWLNLRVGKQRKVDGTEDETASLFNVSYSPEALLKK